MRFFVRIGGQVLSCNAISKSHILRTETLNLHRMFRRGKARIASGEAPKGHPVRDVDYRRFIDYRRFTLFPLLLNINIAATWTPFKGVSLYNSAVITFYDAPIIQSHP